MSDTLRPCPFCGGKAILAQRNKSYHVHCFNCRTEGSSYYTAEEVITRWNRRVVEDAFKTILEQLREIE